MSETSSSHNHSTLLQIAGCNCCKLAARNHLSTLYFGLDRAPKADGSYANRKVAIKLVLLDGSASPERIKRYNDEISAFHEVDHPHIVPLYKLFKEEKSIAFVMRRINGPTLEEARRGMRWTLQMAARLFSQLAAALEALHAHKIIHGDVHIGNVMLWEPINRKRPLKFHAYLLDFGLSRSFQPHEGAEPSQRQDIKGLAQVMLMMLWPYREIEPDYSRGLTHSLIWVLYMAQREDGPFNTIPEFVEAFYRVLRRSRRPNIQPRPPSAYPRQLKKFTAQYDTKAPTQPDKPASRPHPELETTETQQLTADDVITQEAETVQAPDSLRTTTTAPVVMPEQKKRFKDGIDLEKMLMMGIILILLATLLWTVSASAPPPELDAPIIGIEDQQVKLFDPVDRHALHTYKEYPASVYDFSGNGRYLIAERAVIDLQTGGKKRVFNHLPVPKAVAINYDGSIVAFHDGTDLTLWEIATGRLLQTVNGIHLHEVSTILTLAGYDRLHQALLASR